MAKIFTFGSHLMDFFCSQRDLITSKNLLLLIRELIARKRIQVDRQIYFPYQIFVGFLIRMVLF